MNVRVATVIDAVPLFPSLIAVTVVDPAAPPVTNPLALTVAAVVLLLAQLTTRPVSALPDASVVLAVNCMVLPTLRLASAGVTTTEARSEERRVGKECRSRWGEAEEK